MIKWNELQPGDIVMSHYDGWCYPVISIDGDRFSTLGGRGSECLMLDGWPRYDTRVWEGWYIIRSGEEVTGHAMA